MTERRGRHRMAIMAVALATVAVGVGTPTAAPAASPKACLIVDTDVGLDDYRAFAVLASARDLRAVVVTEGISSVPRGAIAVSMFLAAGGDAPPVLPGLTSPTPPAYDWLPAVRDGAERMNFFLHDAVPAAGDPGRLTHEVAAAVRGCAAVDVLVLGPWTSYARYAPALGKRGRIVASGRPFAENNADNFNCEYDLAACRRAPRDTVFVDLPTPGAEPTYDPTEAMVARIEQTGLPGLLRAALMVDPTQWLGTRLWDDAAALYLVAPGKFARQGRHLEPAVPTATFRDLVVAAVNAG